MISISKKKEIIKRFRERDRTYISLNLPTSWRLNNPKVLKSYLMHMGKGSYLSGERRLRNKYILNGNKKVIKKLNLAARANYILRCKVPF